MIGLILKRIFQILALTAAQVLICNQLHFFGYGTPMIYVLLLCYIPLDASRCATLGWAFACGSLIDILSGTPGISSASLLVAAMCQHPLLGALAPRDHADDILPTMRTMGAWRHFVFLFLLTVIHHTVYIGLEYMNYLSWRDMGISLGACIGMSMLLMWIVDSMRGTGRRKGTDITALSNNS